MASARELTHDRQRVHIVCIAILAVVAVWFCGLLLTTNGPLNRLSSQASSARAPSAGLDEALVLPLKMPSTSIHAQSLDYRHAYRQIYGPLNYTVCPSPAAADVQCWLLLHRMTDCGARFAEFIRTMRTHKPAIPPPKHIDPSLRDQFLLGGLTKLSEWYIAETDFGTEVPVWTDSTLKPMIERALVRQPVGHYEADSLSVYHALDCHSITGKTGAVFGTAAPWLEAILFAFGVRHVTTVEYRKVHAEISNHRMLLPLDWAVLWTNGTLQHVDFAFSYSSWEHDGLGRYGDPIDPWGDVKAVELAACYIKPGGLLFFGGPMSTVDQLQYNAHRIYGLVRLPMLMSNWEVLGVYEQDHTSGMCGTQTCQDLYGRWQQKAPVGSSKFQPVVVLRNLRTMPCQRSKQ